MNILKALEKSDKIRRRVWMVYADIPNRHIERTSDLTEAKIVNSDKAITYSDIVADDWEVLETTPYSWIKVEKQETLWKCCKDEPPKKHGDVLVFHPGWGHKIIHYTYAKGQYEAWDKDAYHRFHLELADCKWTELPE